LIVQCILRGAAECTVWIVNVNSYQRLCKNYHDPALASSSWRYHEPRYNYHKGYVATGGCVIGQAKRRTLCAGRRAMCNATTTTFAGNCG